MKSVFLACIVATGLACGSSDGTDAGNGLGQPGMDGAVIGIGGGQRDAATGACAAVSPAGASVSWAENGAAQCAYVVVATRMTNASQDFLEIVGSTMAGVGMGLTVVTYASNLGGTYSCKSDAGIGSVYVDFVYPSGTVVDCTITITNPGTPGSANAVGTFSATVTATSGGTITISNGSFNTPVTSV
jgi:hypothetical protein